MDNNTGNNIDKGITDTVVTDKPSILDKIPRYGIHGGVDRRDWNLRSGMRSQNYAREGFDKEKFRSNYDQIDWSKKSTTTNIQTKDS